MRNNISYYPHRVDAHSHWKFKLLRAKYGWAGEGRFWALNNLIAEAQDCMLDISHKGQRVKVSSDLDITLAELEEFIDYLRDECELLKVSEQGLLYTPHTQEALAEVMKRRKYQARWKKESRQASPPTPPTPAPKAPPNPFSVTDTSPSINITLNGKSAPKGTPGPKKKVATRKGDIHPELPWWQPCVDVWFEFNQSEFHEEPSFKGADPKLLKIICENLEKRTLAKGKAWDKVTAPNTLRHFLTLAHRDTWLKGNFLLTNLERFFDKIIMNANKLNQKTNADTGASVSTSSAFSKIDAMFGLDGDT
jgi:hypothetical protein